jgi:hypothetical protein
MTQNRSPGTGATDAIGALVVAGVLGTFLLPIAVDRAVAVDTTAWSSPATSMWGILGLVIVLAIFLSVVAIGLSSDGKR